jgi:hypothetical protein
MNEAREARHKGLLKPVTPQNTKNLSEAPRSSAKSQSLVKKGKAAVESPISMTTVKNRTDHKVKKTQPQIRIKPPRVPDGNLPGVDKAGKVDKKRQKGSDSRAPNIRLHIRAKKVIDLVDSDHAEESDEVRDEEEQPGYDYQYQVSIGKETIWSTSDYIGRNQSFDLESIKETARTKVSEMSNEDNARGIAVNNEGRLEVKLTCKPAQAPYTRSMTSAEDWEAVLQTMRHYETRNSGQFFVKFDHKFEGVSASASKAVVRLPHIFEVHDSTTF